MRFFEKYIIVYFISLFYFLSLWALTLFLTYQKTTQWNYLFNLMNALLYFSGGILAFYGIRLHGSKSSVGKELFSIGIGMVGFAFGLCVWAYYNLVLKDSIPYPSLADVFFVLYIPFLGYGIINLLREFGFLLSKKIIIESFSIFICASILIFFFGNPPDLSNTISFLAKAFNIFYLIGDSFLITLGIMLIRLTKGRIHKSFFFFILALLLMALADFVFSYRTGAQIYWNGDISDLLYGLSGLSFSLGVTQTILVQLRITKNMQIKS